MTHESSGMLLALTVEIVAAHVSNNCVPMADVRSLIERVHGALASLGKVSTQDKPLEPAVSVRKSVRPDHLVCLEDGKHVKLLKRHLATDHGLSPEQYRVRWNLPSSYPMVAPNYTEVRRRLALETGLGLRDGKSKPVSRSKA